MNAIKICAPALELEWEELDDPASPQLELQWEELNDADPFDQLYRALTVAYTREPSKESAAPTSGARVIPFRTAEAQLAGRVADLLGTRSDHERFGVLVYGPEESDATWEPARDERHLFALDGTDDEMLDDLADRMNAVFDRTNGVPCALLPASWS